MKLKKALACLMVGTMVIAMPVSALAGTHDVSSAEDISKAIATDTDDTVTIILQADVDCASSVWTLLGKKYVINGETYVVKNVSVYGTGTVEVNADVVGTGSTKAALTTSGEADVTVNGDVTATDANGVDANDDSSVTVNGDVTATNENTGNVYGVDASGDSSVTVTGDVTAASPNENNPNGADGVYASENSSVSVEGDVTAEGTGVIAYGYTYDADAGTTVESETTVTVGGDVTATDDGVDADGSSEVGVSGNVTSEKDAGVTAYDDSSVTVGGDVTGGTTTYTNNGEEYSYGYDGIDAYGESEVTVGGDVNGGDGGTSGGDGVHMHGTASVTVGGNVTGGNSSMDGGDGVSIYLQLQSTNEPVIPGVLTVGGSITGGTAAESGNGIYFKDYENPYKYADVSTASVWVYYYDTVWEAASYAAGGTVYPKYEEWPENVKSIYDAWYTEWSSIRNGITENDLDNMSEAEQTALLEKLVPLHNNAIAQLEAIRAFDYSELVIPTITTWGVAGGSGATAYASYVSDEKGSTIAADAVNYTVHIKKSTGGSVTTDKATYKAGETIIITPTPESGYQVSKVYVNGVEIKAVNGVYSYVMPEGGFVEISAEFAKKAPKTGDDNMAGTWALLGGAAGIAAIAAASRRRRNA